MFFRRHRWWFIIGFIVLTIAVAMVIVTQRMTARITTKVKYGDIVEAIYGLGTITPSRSYQLKIGQMGQIVEVFVREGDLVNKGDSLMSIDQGQIITFRAPFSGTITAVPFKSRETVYPQTPLLTLMDLKNRYVVVNLEQEGALRVRNQQVAKLVVESLRGKVFIGKVRTIFPGDNQFLVHIDFTDLPEEMIPGMTGDVAIEVANRAHVLMVPVSAIQAGNVRVLRNNKIKKVPLTIGAIDGRWAEVLSGEVQEGDEILLPKKVE